MKKILYTLLGMMLSVGAWAQTSLQEQINSAEDGATITLRANEELTSTVTIAKSITLNLNGHNITGTGARALQVTNGNVTITGTGTITSTGIADNSSVIRVGDNTTTSNPSLTIDENVTVVSACSYGVTIFGKNESETLVVNGTVKTTSVMASAISGNGSSGLCATAITIGEKANISAGNDVAIYHPQDGSLTVNGTVSGLGGIEIKAGSLTVGGSAKITATGTLSHNANSDGTSTRGYAISIVENTKYKGVSAVTVNPTAVISGPIATLVDSEKDDFNPTLEGITMVAEVGEVKYSKLADALAAATAGETVKLLSDVKLSAKLEVTCSDVTLNLNGKTISPADDNSIGNYCIVMVHRGAKLTIDDSSAEKNGCIDGGTGTNAFYGGIQLTQKDDAPTDAKATLVVNNGIIKGKNAAITGNGNRHNTEITINGGTFTASSEVTGSEGCAIYHPQDGTLTINGGTFSGYGSAVEMRSGTLNITGGNFTATSTDFSEKPNGNGTTIIGAALAISQHTTNKAINVTISGGTFSGPKAVYEKDNQDNNSDNISIAISGGTFNAEVSSENVQNFISGGTFSSAVPEEYCAEGFVPVPNADGTYGVVEGELVAEVGGKKYASLAAAVAAAEAGATVTLLEDITLTARVEPNKDMTIDLNGHTIKSTATCGNGSAFDVKGGAVTIKNGTIDGTAVTETECDAITARSGANVTLEDLNITVNSMNGACAYAFDGSKITIESGNYENKTTETYQYNSSITGMVVNQANNVSQLIFIKGGTFKGYDPAMGDDSQLANENFTFLAPGFYTEKNADGAYVLVDEYTVTDGVPFKTIAKPATVATATYSRTMPSGTKWGTVCVPFTLKSGTIKLYTFGSIEGFTLNVTEVDEVAPGTPVIFYCEASEATFTTENGKVKTSALGEQTGNLVGTYEEQNITEGLSSIYFINGDKFHQAKASLTVPAYRAYIQNTSAGAKAAVLNIVVDGEATAIEGVAADINDTQAIYDVNGRQLSAPQKGINIMKLANGKTIKLIIK